MPRIALDLNNSSDTAEILATPARLVDYDDSKWEVCTNVRATRSVGFCFAWYRITVEVPSQVNGADVTGSRVLFETNVDNYAEVWVDGAINRATGAMNGLDCQHRVEVTANAQPGEKHVIAVLAVNGPLAEPRGGVFLRYATLAFESRG